MTNEADHHLLRWLSLAHTPGLGLVGANRLLAAYGDIEALFRAGLDDLSARGVRREIALALTRRTGLAPARQELARIRRAGIHCLTRSDPAYPPLLQEISDPPLILYGQGDLAALRQPVLAVVGARSASVYGRKMAETLAGDLAATGITVISGGALGIDSAAHQGALAAPAGRTVAVLGCGLDVIYPPQNKKLFAMIAATGMLLSEYPLGTKPEPFRFPARNRIISGIAVGTVVIEAARRSGSLITAEMALDQGREVFAVPGRADSSKSEGCHRLIQEGAKLVHRSADILAELALSPLPAQSQILPGPELAPPLALDGDAGAILAVLDEYPRDIEEIIATCRLPTQRVNAGLLELELLGRVETEPGPQYRKTSSPAA